MNPDVNIYVEKIVFKSEQTEQYWLIVEVLGQTIVYQKITEKEKQLLVSAGVRVDTKVSDKQSGMYLGKEVEL